MQGQNPDIWEVKKREFFSRSFCKALENWKKKDKENSQEKFAELADTNRNSVTKWKKGTDYPSPVNMRNICSVLGVTEEYFSPIFDFERGGDKTFHDERNEELHDYASKIDLNEALVRFVTSIDSIGDSFPLQSMPIKDIVPTDSPYQIKTQSGPAFLSKRDLDFLKSIQSSVEEFIRFKMYEETKRLEREKAKRPSALKMKQSEIDELFKTGVDPKAHKANLASGATEEELKAFYEECDRAELAEKEEYIKAFLNRGGIIENG